MKISRIGKVLDIAARHNGSLAVDENGCVYIWGQCFNEEITVPTVTAFSNMYDVLLYNVSYIIYKPLNDPTKEKSNILECLGKAFDDQVCLISYLFILHVIFLFFKMKNRIDQDSGGNKR